MSYNNWKHLIFFRICNLIKSENTMHIEADEIEKLDVCVAYLGLG